jgi:hypothetical protein
MPIPFLTSISLTKLNKYYNWLFLHPIAKRTLSLRKGESVMFSDRDLSKIA